MPPGQRALTASWLGAVLVAASSTPAAGAERSGGAPNVGHVTFVTDKRGYLDRGLLDGLRARQSVALVRGGRPVGSCAIERLGDHEATCTGGRPRVDDSFRITSRRPPRKTAPAVSELPPLLDDATLATRATAIAETSYDRVDFNGAHTARARPSAEVGPGLVVWQSQPSSPADYVQQRIDGAVHAVELGRSGLRADASFTAMRWQNTAGIERFRPETPTQFYLWEAEISRRRVDGNTVLAAGRLWPWHAPGLTVLDGVQIGRQNDEQTAEGGAYAGLIPTALGLVPSTDAWAAGLYGALAQAAPRRGSAVRVARQEARIGVWRAPGGSLVTEGEALAQIWVGALTVGGGGRVRYAPEAPGQSLLDRAYLDLGVRPGTTVGGGLRVRYFGATPLDQAPLAGEMPALRGSVHGLADLRWDVASWLGLATFAGAHVDRDTGRRQAFGAGELRLPRLFGDAGGASLGAQVDEGWLRGRSAYAQFVLRTPQRLQLLARASGSMNEFETPDAALDIFELGGYAHLEGVLTSWLRLRAWSLLRIPVSVQGQTNPGAGYGTMLGGTMTGVF
jgi:hypothetical protein